MICSTLEKLVPFFNFNSPPVFFTRDSKKAPSLAKRSAEPRINKLSEALVTANSNLEVSERKPIDLVRTSDIMTSKILIL